MSTTCIQSLQCFYRLCIILSAGGFIYSNRFLLIHVLLGAVLTSQILQQEKFGIFCEVCGVILGDKDTTFLKIVEHSYTVCWLWACIIYSMTRGKAHLCACVTLQVSLYSVFVT